MRKDEFSNPRRASQDKQNRSATRINGSILIKKAVHSITKDKNDKG